MVSRLSRKDQDFVRRRRETMSPEWRLETAYHEAGHAAALFLFGRPIPLIDMWGDRRCVAYVRTRCLEPQMVRYHPKFFWHDAKIEIFFNLAGLAAASRFRGEQDHHTHWLDAEIEGDAWRHYSASDMYSALEYAQAVHGDNGHAWRLLGNVAIAADAAMAHPQVWRVVTAMAEALNRVNRRILGDRVMRIMRSAWPDAGEKPYMKLGSRWRRPFQPRNDVSFLHLIGLQ